MMYAVLICMAIASTSVTNFLVCVAAARTLFYAIACNRRDARVGRYLFTASCARQPT